MKIRTIRSSIINCVAFISRKKRFWGKPEENISVFKKKLLLTTIAYLLFLAVSLAGNKDELFPETKDKHSLYNYNTKNLDSLL